MVVVIDVGEGEFGGAAVEVGEGAGGMGGGVIVVIVRGAVAFARGRLR